MAQDLRNMMRNSSDKTPKLSAEHESKFASKLEAAFENEKKAQTANARFAWMKMASIIVVFLGLGTFGYYQLSDKNEEVLLTESTPTEGKTLEDSPQMTLGDISPDFEKIENFYMTGINMQLASLEITNDNKDVIDGYMEQLAILDKEYAALNEELSEMGPSEATITALIDNLKLRLELLFKLKNKLKELKNQDNEQFNSIQA